MKHESSLMMKRAHTTLRGAQALLDTSTDFGGAISRAYYAAFYAASAVLSEADIVTKTHRCTHHRFYDVLV